MMERKQRKPGLYEQRISADRERRAKALNRQIADPSAAYHAHKDFTKVPVGVIHGELRGAAEEHRHWGYSRLAALFQGDRLSFTEQGDFTSCFRRGI